VLYNPNMAHIERVSRPNASLINGWHSYRGLEVTADCMPLDMRRDELTDADPARQLAYAILRNRLDQTAALERLDFFAARVTSRLPAHRNWQIDGDELDHYCEYGIPPTVHA
jgi:hypothetical protein